MAYRTLELTLISARDLKDVNLFSKMKVYAVVCIAGDHQYSQQRTPTDRDNGKNPAWNFTLRFSVPPTGGLSRHDLHILLRSEDALGYRPVGEVRTPISELFNGPAAKGPSTFVSYQVRMPSGMPSGKYMGVLNLSCKLMDSIPPSATAYLPQAAKNEEPAGPSNRVEPQPTNFGLAQIFSHKQLKDATNNFNDEIGDGGFSKVYLGQLNKRKVAVKVLFDGIAKGFEQFINEVTVVSRLHHKNLVTVHGCTDPKIKKNLMIVYEYVPNGTIAEHLHGQLSPLTWDVRIQLAVETAEALDYLHSQVPIIIHRDVKTSNILLDGGLHAKVADLGMCRLVPWDTTDVSTQPQGTAGSRDPECDLYLLLTAKSDVFSFGVVLLELMSGKQAVDVNRVKENSLEDVYLYNWAVKKILNRELEQLVDPKLQYDSNHQIRRSVDSMAKLACSCLEMKRERRPPMSVVLMELKRIRDLI